MSPHFEALAFRLWASCETYGWERPLKEIADELQVDWRLLASVVRHKGWTGRIGRGRVRLETSGMPYGLDAVDGSNYRQALKAYGIPQPTHSDA